MWFCEYDDWEIGTYIYILCILCIVLILLLYIYIYYMYHRTLCTCVRNMSIINENMQWKSRYCYMLSYTCESFFLLSCFAVTCKVSSFLSNIRNTSVWFSNNTLTSRILAIHGIPDSTNSPRKLWHRASTRTCGPRIVCMLGLFPFPEGKTLRRTPSCKLRWPIKMIKNFTHGSLCTLMTYGCTGRQIDSCTKQCLNSGCCVLQLPHVTIVKERGQSSHRHWHPWHSEVARTMLQRGVFPPENYGDLTLN